VGNFWFKKLCNIFDSRYILPTCQSLQNQIYQRFENHRNLIAKELSELTVKVSLTADIWTSISNQAYLEKLFQLINEMNLNDKVLNYPMYKATKMLSSSSYPTVSDIWLTFIGIFQHIELYIENQNHSIEKCMMADSIRKKLEDYWTIITIIDKSTIISTLLDPFNQAQP
ncbi:9075_t:CDS:2, partial [Entrophospora sp. SA101]